MGGVRADGAVGGGGSVFRAEALVYAEAAQGEKGEGRGKVNGAEG